MRPLTLLLSLLLSLQTSSRLPISGVAGVTSSGGGSSITIVQHKSAHCNATTCALSYTSNNASANVLIYLSASNTGTLNAATDNNSNTIVNTVANQNTHGGTLRIDCVNSSNSGANTVTANATGANRTHIHIYEVSGMGASACTADAKNSGTQTATSSPSISTSSATTHANDLVVGFFYDQPNNDSLTAGTGFSPSEFQDGGSGNESSLSEVKIVSSTGTQTATASCSPANDIGDMVAALKGT